MAINHTKKLSMKKIYRNTGLIIGLLAILLLGACKEKIDPIVDELDFDRAFTPVGLSAQISNITTVTLTWDVVKNAENYVIEIYDGIEILPTKLLHTANVAADITTLSYLLPAGDTWFSARIKALSSLDGVAESKWLAIDFKTAPENLFAGYTSIMTGLGAVTVNWAPGTTATALAFHNGTSEISYPLTAGEIASGIKVMTGVPNGDYEIRLMNSTFVRGRTNLLLEGDAMLDPGGDLNAAIDALPSGGVLILTNGEKYGMSEPDTVRVSVKIRGLYPDNLPTIYLVTGGGNHMFDIDPAMTPSDSLVFENVDISCSYDDAGLLKHRGIIDQELTAMNIGKIRFLNCTIRNSGRSAIRLRGNAAGQTINLVEFNGCIMYDFAFDSHYGVLNGAATGNFINIKFINSTVFNLRGGIINYGSGAGCQSVVLDNCTFDRIVMDASTARYFIDFGTTGNLSAGTITINNCIFGETSALANGVRNNLMTLTNTGSYYTSNYINVAGSITGAMTAYAGTSTALWIDPVATFDFHFLDQGFAGKNSAGDPRWIP